MAGEIVTAISTQISAAFGDQYSVYPDKVGQDSQKPCFLIAMLQSSRSPRANGRCIERNSFDVHYYPANADSMQELHDTAGRLYSALEVLSCPDGSKIRGTDRHYEIADGVLHFFITYNLYLMRRVDLPIMGSLDVNADTKEG